MDENEFPYFIVCGDTWIHVTDYNEQTMSYVINKADKYMAFGKEVEHNLQIQLGGRGWMENNFVRNVIGVSSMVIGGVEVVLGSITTVGEAVTEAPTGGLSTAVIAGGIVTTLGGVGDFTNGWDMIMNYDNQVFTQELADKLADLSYSQLKKNLENRVDVPKDYNSTVYCANLSRTIRHTDWIAYGDCWKIKRVSYSTIPLTNLI